MINRNTLIGLAAATFALLLASAAMGEDFGEGNAFLWTSATSSGAASSPAPWR